jgi:hypothetical protein
MNFENDFAFVYLPICKKFNWQPKIKPSGHHRDTNSSGNVEHKNMKPGT